MDTTLLTVFQEVARQGTFTGTAEALGYTQSAAPAAHAVVFGWSPTQQRSRPADQAAE